jgi:tRNA 2-thiocytidine biosynthesis protein TtcA
MGVPHRIEYRDTYSIVTDTVTEGRTYCALCSRLRRGNRRPPGPPPARHVAEADCARFATAMGYPVIPCDLCGSQDGLQRAAIKRLLDGWEAASPGRRATTFRALTQVRPGALLDPALLDFAAL